MAYNRRYRNNKNSKKRLSKKDWRNIVITIVVVLLTFGVISGVATLFDSETKTVHPLFVVGGIDDTNGEHVDTEGSIYTKDAFECKGLAVQLDFDAHITYQAFFYDNLDNYISASPVYDQGAELDVPENAVYARLEVTPIWEEINVDEEADTDAEADEDAEPENVIKWYDVSKYANQLTITVLNEQGNDEENAEDKEAEETCAEHNYVVGACSNCGDQLTNLFSADKWTSTQYYSNGSLISAGDTDPYALANIEENIIVKPGDVVQSNILFYTTSYNNASCIRVAGFDADGNWVSDVLTPSSTVTEAGFVVPEGIYQLNIPLWADQLESGEEIYIYVWEK